MKFDLIVIGGGPGGYNAALRAAEAGKSVAVIERDKLGGVCLNCGCIPSKSLLQCAKVADYARSADKYGISVTCESQSTTHIEVNTKTILDRKNRIVRKLVGGVKLALKNASVSIIEGEAIIVGKCSDDFEIRVGEVSHTCEHLIIASGSSAAIPPIDGLLQSYQEGFALSNKEIFDLSVIPQNLVVIGGGVIGLEMASYFQSVGATVTVIEALDYIAGNTDREISSILQSNYAKKGVDFLIGCTVKKVSNGAVEYTDKEGVSHTATADKVLVAVGRRANKVEGIESLGIETNRNYIITDSKLRTNVDKVYAVGDINGKVMLAHTAYREGEVAVNSILGIDDAMDYDAIPSVIYTSPEVASVGLTQAQATERGIQAHCVCLPMQYSGRYVAENSITDGIAKFVFDDKHILIGAVLIANGASEIITALSICVGLKVTVEQLKRIVFAHPTVGEIIREAIFSI